MFAENMADSDMDVWRSRMQATTDKIDVRLLKIKDEIKAEVSKVLGE